MEEFSILKAWLDGLIPNQRDYICSQCLFLLPIQKSDDWDQHSEEYFYTILECNGLIRLEAVGLLLSIISIIDYTVFDFDDSISYDERQQRVSKLNIKSMPEYPPFEDYLHTKESWVSIREKYLNVGFIAKKYPY